MTTPHAHNPFLLRSKFQMSHPCSSMYSSSCTSLLGPTVSVCPRKKYSTNNWYDYKSSNPQISQKVLYRMQSQYYRLQALHLGGYDDHEHINSCLIAGECRKNPFHKQSLIQMNYANKNPMAESFNPHWTEESRGDKFIGPDSLKNIGDSIKEYRLLRQKMANNSQKIVPANSMYDRADKNNLKITFGEQTRFLNGQSSIQFQLKKKQTDESPRQKNQNQQSPRTKYSETKTQKKYYQSDIVHKKNSENDSVKKVNWRGKTFYTIPLGIEE